jgi:hypothetical protein
MTLEGSDTRVRDLGGDTVLLAAVRSGSVGCVKSVLLLEVLGGERGRGLSLSSVLGGAGALSYGRCVERLLRPARAGGAKTRSHPDEATRTGWCDRWYRLRDIIRVTGICPG